MAPIFQPKNASKIKKKWKKEYKTPVTIFGIFVLNMLLGSNILFSLRNFFNTETFPIDGRQAPYNNPAKFPYSLCPGPINTADGASNPCFAVIKWLAQTIALSWISWRRMMLLNPTKGLKKNDNIYAHKIPQDGDIIEWAALLFSPIIVLVILALGGIFSTILTYCASFGAKGGMLFTILFTFLPPIMPLLITPILSLLQILNVLYILLIKPLLTGSGWTYLIRNFANFVAVPLILMCLFLIFNTKIINLPAAIPWVFYIGLMLFYFNGLRGGWSFKKPSPKSSGGPKVLSPLPPQPPGIKGVALG